MHLLGDFPSPLIVGFISDLVHDARTALLLLCLWLFWTVGFWTGAAHFARRRVNAMKLNLLIKMQQNDLESDEPERNDVKQARQNTALRREIDHYETHRRSASAQYKTAENKTKMNHESEREEKVSLQRLTDEAMINQSKNRQTKRQHHTVALDVA
jgi:hypothetical protein